MSAAPPPPRRRGRPTQAERRQIRQAILDAAWAEFVDRGYGGATVQRIAAAARIGIATFYVHFPDKAAVFAAVLGDVGASLSARTPAYGPEIGLEAGLLRFGEVLLTTFSLESHPEAARLMYAEARRFPELTALFVGQSDGWLESLASFIGRWRPDVAHAIHRDLALLFAEMVAGRFHREQMLGLPADPDRLRSHLAMCVAVFSTGIAKAPLCAP